MALVPAEFAGAPCWISLAARDLAASEAFYRAVLGWTFRRGSFGRAFSVAETDGVAVAGIAEVARELAVPVAWTPYFAVDDADGAVARIRERGGTVGVGPVAYPPRGRAALALDREGAAFGIWEGRVLAEWRIGSGTAPAWLELHSQDAFAAALFYGEVLQWSLDSGRGCCDISYEHDQVVLRYGGEAVARLNSGPVEEAASKPHLRPRWLVHFRVRDLQAATASAVEHGGTVVTGGPWPDGDGQVTVRDPDGALFTLDESPTAPWPTS
ncbi:VOC family protein [Streptomyces sp. WAC07061]|uniref:VOC family protein n=1 Tax=Streptomyces sp. WAC07061 TaxID=2487410 RepID=UPI000F7829F3|nr:VOC family protein [Streptomyces sp. WAC07061]RSS57790.1 VOC family protein [Streptomyces sp. WAC07061]